MYYLNESAINDPTFWNMISDPNLTKNSTSITLLTNLVHLKTMIPLNTGGYYVSKIAPIYSLMKTILEIIKKELDKFFFLFSPFISNYNTKYMKVLDKEIVFCYNVCKVTSCNKQGGDMKKRIMSFTLLLLFIFITAGEIAISAADSNSNFNLKFQRKLDTSSPKIQMYIAKQIKMIAESEGISFPQAKEIFFTNIEGYFSGISDSQQTIELDEYFKEISSEANYDVEKTNGNTRRSPKSKFKWKLPKSKKGDVYFSYGNFTFGHVGLYSEDNRVIEITGIGKKVVELPINSPLTYQAEGNVNGVDIMAVRTNGKTINAAVKKARYYKGRGYDINFFENKTKYKKRNPRYGGGYVRADNVLNCSELVWRSYLAGGLDLDANKGGGVYPKDIRNSQYTRRYKKAYQRNYF